MSAEAREVERNGRSYLVFPIIAAREMVLDYPEHGTRELLPAARLKESAEMWAGTPITFIHPENPARTADIPEEYTETVIGQAYSPQIIDNEKLRVQAWIDIQKALDIGGLAEDVVEQLRDGDDVSVSAGYATLDDDRSGGTHNGEQYDIAQGYIIPDHIAVFPSDEFTARCSWEDGCGAPRANASEYQTCSDGPCSCGYHVNALSEARTPTYDGLTSAEWEPPTFTELVEAWYENRDQDAPDNIEVGTVAQEAVDWAAQHTLVGDPDADNAGEVISFPVVNTEGELNEDGLLSARTLAYNSEAEESIYTVTAKLLEKHSGDWPSGNTYSEMTENASRENIHSANGNIRYVRPGEYVKWDTDGGEAFGQILRVVEDGAITVAAETKQTQSAEDRLVEILQYERGKPTSNRLVKRLSDGSPNEDNLRSWDAPRTVRDFSTGAPELQTNGAKANIEMELDWSEGDMVHWQGFPQMFGKIVHIDMESHKAMVEVHQMEDGEPVSTGHTFSAGFSDIVAMDDARMNSTVDTSGESCGCSHSGARDRPVRNAEVTAEIGDRTIDLHPPESVMNAAELALEKKDEFDELADCGSGRGEQRATQIVNGDLSPEDFLTRENGTPIPTYLDSHSEDVSGIDSTPTDWSDETWTDGCGPVQYALWGGTATGTGLNWAEGVKDDLEAAIEAAGDDFTLNAHITTMSQQQIEPTELSLRHNVAPYLASEWDVEPGLAEAFCNALDPQEPDGSQAFAATIANAKDGVDVVDVQTVLAEAEARETATLDLNYEPPEVAVDGGVGPHVDRLNARSHIAPFLAEKWGKETTEVISVINALDPDHPDDYRALVTNYPGETEPSTDELASELESLGQTEDDLRANAVTEDTDPATIRSQFSRFLEAMGFSRENAEEVTAEANEVEAPTPKANSMGEGDYVQWDWNGGTAYGQITEIVEDGERTVDGNTREVDADDGEMIAVIEHMSEDGESKDQEVLKYIREDGENEGNLRSWDAPKTNAMHEYETKEEAMEAAEEMGCEGAHEMDGMWMPCDSHDTFAEMKENAESESDDQTESESAAGSDPEDSVDDKENTITMQMNVNELASHSAFGVAELQEWSDDELMALEQTVLSQNDDLVADEEADTSEETADDGHQSTTENAEAESDADAESEAEASVDADETKENSADGAETDTGADAEAADTDTENPTVSENTEAETESEETEVETEDSEAESKENSELQELRSQVNELTAMVEDIANQKANAEKDRQARVVANAIDGMTKDAALELPEERLEDMAEKHANKTNFSAVPGQMDRGGQQMKANATSEDVDEYPAGGRSDWEARKSGGD